MIDKCAPPIYFRQGVIRYDFTVQEEMGIILDDVIYLPSLYKQTYEQERYQHTSYK